MSKLKLTLYDYYLLWEPDNLYLFIKFAFLGTCTLRGIFQNVVFRAVNVFSYFWIEYVLLALGMYVPSIMAWFLELFIQKVITYTKIPWNSENTSWESPHGRFWQQLERQIWLNSHVDNLLCGSMFWELLWGTFLKQLKRPEWLTKWYW